MKNLLLLLFLLSTMFSNSQIVIEYDNMETSSSTYLTAGWWTPAPTTGWFTNASVSPTLSAALYGSGNGSSGIEQDWYSIPNVTGLNPAKQYQFKFRLASYTFSNPTATTKGTDAADYVTVQVSTNGGATYVNELRITGNSNAQWTYSSTGMIYHTANGVFTNSAFPTGDVYQAPAGSSTTAPTYIILDLPIGITQVAVDIYCRVNSAGEEWWIDNIELVEETSLPIELVFFNGVENDGTNLLYWQTASEKDNDYFTIERSSDGEEWINIGEIIAAGNSTQLMNYSYSDKTYKRGVVNYYKLSQTDFNGVKEYFNIVSINNTLNQKKVVKIINMMGQEVTSITSNGFYIEVYDDGTMLKVWK
jgi:hypothetical protein